MGMHDVEKRRVQAYNGSVLALLEAHTAVDSSRPTSLIANIHEFKLVVRFYRSVQFGLLVTRSQQAGELGMNWPAGRLKPIE